MQSYAVIRTLDLGAIPPPGAQIFIQKMVELQEDQVVATVGLIEETEYWGDLTTKVAQIGPETLLRISTTMELTPPGLGTHYFPT